LCFLLLSVLEVVKTNIVERWSKERDETKAFSKPFNEKVSIQHNLWIQSFHLSIDDRPTCHITDKQKKKRHTCLLVVFKVVNNW
jgi:hypothetical protein